MSETKAKTKKEEASELVGCFIFLPGLITLIGLTLKVSGLEKDWDYISILCPLGLGLSIVLLAIICEAFCWLLKKL